MKTTMKRKPKPNIALAQNRIQETFAKLKADGRKAFISFITAGDPDPKTTEQLILELEKCGASIVELGVPFSDPIADGPTIQSSFTRVLEGKFHLDDVFGIVSRVRKQSCIPIMLMLSYSIVFRTGIKTFVKRSAAAGVDGLIVPDVPPEAAGELCTQAQAAGLAMTFLVTPATRPERIKTIIESTTGFVYYVSVMGITGARRNLPKEINSAVRKLKRITDKPVCIGFGVSRPEHVARLSKVADGVIVGSALVRRVTEAVDKGKSPVKVISSYVRKMIGALP